MSLETLFAVWVIALALALLAIAVIVRTLFLVLAEVCGTRERARFWTLYTSLLILLAPLVTVSDPDLLDAAIIAALLVTGRAIWRPIASMLQMPAAPPRQDPLA